MLIRTLLPGHACLRGQSERKYHSKRKKEEEEVWKELERESSQLTNYKGMYHQLLSGLTGHLSSAAGPILQCLHLSHLFSFQTKDARQSEWIICKVPGFLSHPCTYILGWGEGKCQAAATFWRHWGHDTPETWLVQTNMGKHYFHCVKLNEWLSHPRQRPVFITAQEVKNEAQNIPAGKFSDLDFLPGLINFLSAKVCFPFWLSWHLFTYCVKSQSAFLHSGVWSSEGFASIVATEGCMCVQREHEV